MGLHGYPLTDESFQVVTKSYKGGGPPQGEYLEKEVEAGGAVCAVTIAEEGGIPQKRKKGGFG